MNHWAMQYDQCTSCGTTTTPHHANGLCRTCYHKQYQRKAPANRNTDLERFVNDLPSLLRSVNVSTLSVTYKDGSVVIKHMGTKLSTTWTP